MRLLRLAAAALLSGLTCLDACVGEDVTPSSTQKPSDDGGAASPTADGSSAGDAGGSSEASTPSNCVVKTSGPRAPMTVVDVGQAGPWSMPGNAKVPDGMFASVFLSTGGTLSSDSLEAKNFSFAIPPAASILGIEVQVTRGPGSGTGLVKDKAVSIGDVTGQLSTERTDNENWSTTSSTVSYGGASDRWGLELTPRLLESANFGVRIRAVLATPDPMSAEIDAIALDVTYCE
jgi:hypothetical protein